MFILNLTGPADRPDRPPIFDPVILPNHRHGRNNNQPSSEPDCFDGTVEDLICLNSWNAHLSEFGRRVIESINGENGNGLSPGTKDFITKLVSDRAFRLHIINDLYGPEVVNYFNDLHKKGDKEAEQREMLMCLLAIPEPTQIIAAINAMKGALSPAIRPLAEGMLAQARDLAQWFAEKRAKKGDAGAALALYQAEQVGGDNTGSPIQTFIRGMTYDPAALLVQSQSTADEANRRREDGSVIRALIRQEENIVNNSPVNSPIVEQARTRLTGLRSRNIGLG